MLKSVCLALFVGLVFICRSTVATDSTSQSLAAIAPFIDDQTVLIGKYDLTQLDIALTIKQWLAPFAVTDEQRKILTAVVEQFDGWSRRLKADGISQFYIVSSIGHLPNPDFMRNWNQDLFERLLANTTFAVVPGASGTLVEEFHHTLQDKAKQTWPGIESKMWPDCRQIHGAAVVGMGTLLDQLNGIEPVARPEFETALTAAENKPICFAVVPPQIFARAAEEILREPVPGTKLPAGPIIAKGFRWLAVGEEPILEKFNLQVVIQSASTEAAQALAGAIKSGTAACAKQLGSDAAAATVLTAAQLLTLLPEAKGDQLLLTIDTQQANLLRGLAQTALMQATADAFRHQSFQNLKNIGLAMLNEVDRQHHYPDRAIRDKDGKPLLSWRVAILPELGEGSLYKEFHLDEAWDSDHNRPLVDRMPEVFHSPDTGSQHPGRTRYLVPVGENLMFPPSGTVTVKEVIDGTSKTIMVVEADPDHAVVWTKPDDLEIDLDNPRWGVFNGKLPCNTCFADGSARSIRNDVDSKVLQRLFQRNDGNVLDPASF